MRCTLLSHPRPCAEDPEPRSRGWGFLLVEESTSSKRGGKRKIWLEMAGVFCWVVVACGRFRPRAGHSTASSMSATRPHR